MRFTFLVWLCIAADALVKKSSQMQRRLKDLGGESSEHLSIQIRRHLFSIHACWALARLRHLEKVYKIELTTPCHQPQPNHELLTQPWWNKLWNGPQARTIALIKMIIPLPYRCPVPHCKIHVRISSHDLVDYGWSSLCYKSSEANMWHCPCSLWFLT